MTVDIRIEASGWDTLDLATLVAKAEEATLSELGLDAEECVVSLVATDDASIAALNAEFRDKPTPTNVLSWPAQELSLEAPGLQPATPRPDAFGELELGDIALAWETCQREAEAAGKPLTDHVTHLVVHGLLHLMGYDHVRDADATLMEALEVTILCTLGLPDPYDVDA